MDAKNDDMKQHGELAEVHAQSRQNSQQISELRADFNRAMDRISTAMEDMGKRINQAAAPNFATMAAWAAVVMMVVGAIATPIGYFAIREWDRHDESLKAMDVKLQREFSLVTERTDAEIKSLNDTSKERHNEAMDQVHRLQTELDGLLEFRDSQLRDDLQELRTRRYKDNAMLPPATKAP